MLTFAPVLKTNEKNFILLYSGFSKIKPNILPLYERLKNDISKI